LRGCARLTVTAWHRRAGFARAVWQTLPCGQRLSLALNDIQQTLCGDADAIGSVVTS